MAKKAYIGVENFKPRDLPSGYTQVEHIQSSGTQYIDTGFKANQDTKVVMRAVLTAKPSTAQATFFGGRTSATSKAYALSYYPSDDYYRYFYNGKYKSTTLTGDPYETKVMITDKNTVTVGDSSYSWTYGNFQCDYTMYLLATNAAGTADWMASAKLYSCQIYDNGTLVRDFIPCINASGVVGLYDVVNGVFYSDAAGGTFTAGSSENISVARKISKMYIGVNGVARKVKKAYIGVNGVAREWFVRDITWAKYSCVRSGGTWVRSDEYAESQTKWFYFYYDQTITEFGDNYTFSDSTGFSITDKWNGEFNEGVTVEDVENALVDKYCMYSSGASSQTLSLVQVVHNVEEYGSARCAVLLGLYLFQDATRQPYVYSKGSTSYGKLIVPDGSLPESGTLIEGSAEQGYCVLMIGANYYYYVIE